MDENAMVVFHGFLNLPTKRKMQMVSAMNDYFDAVHREPIRLKMKRTLKGSISRPAARFVNAADDNL